MLPTNPKQQYVDVVLLKKSIDESGKAIRRVLEATGILTDARAIADRFMCDRGGDGTFSFLFLFFLFCFVCSLLTADW